MDKNAIKKYAIWARQELIARVTQKAQQYGVTKDAIIDINIDNVNGRLLSDVEKKQRQVLIKKIKENGFEQVMEEVAYTWFNRFTALRFMEVNNYLPSHTRIFTNELNEFKPQILADAISLDFDGLNMDKVFELKNANKDEELYKYLLLLQCNLLGEIMPGIFQKLEDYTELLLPDYLLRDGSVLEQMISGIPQNDWKEQVEIIGWLYQYYISVKHDEVVDVRKKSAIEKENVPAATQIFTPDWVVKYMVDNSLGKYWMSSHKESALTNQMNFYVESSEPTITRNVTAKDVTFVDPCMGSGHILAYAFDLLLEIYREEGYTDRDAVESILTHNLFGIDVDERAFQLAYFSICMKARSIDRRFFKRGISLNLIHVPESNSIDLALCNKFIVKDFVPQIKYLVNAFCDAKEYGSLLEIENKEFNTLKVYLDEYEISYAPTIEEILFEKEQLPKLKQLVKAALLLSKKYAAVCTNPPYHNKYDKKLEKYVLQNYPEAKADLYSVFIIRNLKLCKIDGYSGMMTPHGWMFTKSYEGVRKSIITSRSVSTLIHMAKGAFYSEAAVDICSFVLRNKNEGHKGKYIRLEKFKGDMEIQKKKVLEAINSGSCDYIFECGTDNFERIDGIPFSYWVSEQIYKDFEIGDPMKKVSPPRQGMATTNNDRFLRMWFEVPFDKIGFGMSNEDMSADSGKKYFPYNKGGEFRRWYGNNYYVVNFKNHGKELCDYIDVTAAPKFNHKNRVINREFYFKECITWSDISAEFSGRYCPEGFIFDIKGSSGFPPKDKLFYILGLLNSKLTQAFIDILNPTITTQVGDMSRIPILYGDEQYIESLVKECVLIGKKLWDSHEISWDFNGHPYVLKGKGKLQNIFLECKQEYENDQKRLIENERLINESIFNVYGVPELLSEYVIGEKEVVQLDEKEMVIELMSFVVGCMFGRYSFRNSGLQYAGEINKEPCFDEFVDRDNIIPICADEYFTDDIVVRFETFIRTVFGEENVEENLSYIATVIGGNGNSRQIIRGYYQNMFYADHIKRYQKRPVYWLFESGKKNGFKALVYIHRYTPDTIARMRTDYVHEQQSRYRTAIADLEQRIVSAATSERVKLNKKLKTLKEQAAEIQVYEEKIHHLADQYISINLDDGVKANYAKFQDVLAKIK